MLALTGAKMIYEGAQEGIGEDISDITNKLLLALAIATSLDAMVAGFSLTLLHADPYVACLVIGAITFVFSIVGVVIGRKSGTWVEIKAEIFGGTVLILMVIKMLIF